MQWHILQFKPCLFLRVLSLYPNFNRVSELHEEMRPSIASHHCNRQIQDCAKTTPYAFSLKTHSRVLVVNKCLYLQKPSATTFNLQHKAKSF